MGQKAKKKRESLNPMGLPQKRKGMEKARAKRAETAPSKKPRQHPKPKKPDVRDVPDTEEVRRILASARPEDKGRWDRGMDATRAKYTGRLSPLPEESEAQKRAREQKYGLPEVRPSKEVQDKFER